MSTVRHAIFALDLIVLMERVTQRESAGWELKQLKVGAFM